MSKYQLRYWYEHGGFCIWSMNKEAKEKYGYSIKNSVLPISEELVSKMDVLEEEYASYLDWNNPQDPSLWTYEHKNDFINRACKVYEELEKELGSSFQVVNEIDRCFD